MAQMTRHPSELTEAQIKELRAKLQAKDDDLTKEIRDLEYQLTQAENNEDQGAPDEVDRSSYEENIQRSQIVLAGKKNLQFEVREALKRIDEGTYGICEETGEPIGYKRLLAQPWTRLSLEAQQELEMRRKNSRPSSGGGAPGGFPSGFGE
jgi:DnaK suppressor protein